MSKKKKKELIKELGKDTVKIIGKDGLEILLKNSSIFLEISSREICSIDPKWTINRLFFTNNIKITTLCNPSELESEFHYKKLKFSLFQKSTKEKSTLVVTFAPKEDKIILYMYPRFNLNPCCIFDNTYELFGEHDIKYRVRN